MIDLIFKLISDSKPKFEKQLFDILDKIIRCQEK